VGQASMIYKVFLFISWDTYDRISI